MRPIAHPVLNEVTLPAVLYALSDPVRLEIVSRLMEANGELSCGDATDAVLPKSTMSFHFKALREAGLIRTRQQGRTKFNAIHPGFEKRFPGLLGTLLTLVSREKKQRRGKSPLLANCETDCTLKLT